MSEPYIKAIASDDRERLSFVMDREGFEYFRRLIARAEARRGDNAAAFNQFKARIDGAFLAGGVVLGWESKKRNK